MPNTAFYQERILNTLEAQEAALEAIQVSQASIAAADGSGAFSVTYIFPAKDFGAGDFTEDIQGPPGVRGLVKAVSIYDVTEIFSITTLEARVEVGIQGGDVDAYVDTADFGALAVAAALTPALTLGVVGTIPAGEDILVTGFAPTGGTPTGIATVAVTINYFI